MFVLCLNAPDETHNSLFPKVPKTELTFGDFTVTLISETAALHVIERKLKLTSSDTNTARDIFVYHAKNWPASTTNWPIKE